MGIMAMRDGTFIVLYEFVTSVMPAGLCWWF